MHDMSLIRVSLTSLAVIVSLGFYPNTAALGSNAADAAPRSTVNAANEAAATPFRLAQVENRAGRRQDRRNNDKKDKRAGKKEKQRANTQRRSRTKPQNRAKAAERKARQVDRNAEQARRKTKERASKAKTPRRQVDRKAAPRRATRKFRAIERAEQQRNAIRRTERRARDVDRKAEQARRKTKERARKATTTRGQVDRKAAPARATQKPPAIERAEQQRNAKRRAERRARDVDRKARRRARRASERQHDMRQRRQRFQAERARRRAQQSVVRNTRRQRVVNRRIRDARGRLHVARIRRFRAVDRRYRNRFRRGVSVYYLPPVAGIALSAYLLTAAAASYDDYVYALSAPPLAPRGRRYALDVIISDPRIRSYARPIDLNTIEFAFGSADLSYAAVDRLEELADAMLDVLHDDPTHVFLVAGHTDAVGSFESNLELSEERAASVVEVLVAEYGVPARNLEAVGYGEQYLRINTPGPERRNRRVVVRAIGGLLADRMSRYRHDY